MASKKALLGGTQIKVENVSGFDKSRFNAFTAPLGAIVPMVKQLCLPGKISLKVKISAQLPPLATDAFLRSHLKVEAFLVPMRLCYGGFQSWFSGEKIVVSGSGSGSTLGVAKLPFFSVRCTALSDLASSPGLDRFKYMFGPHSLMDYFGVKWPLLNGIPDSTKWPQSSGSPVPQAFNIFPFVAYGLCYDHFYRNKLIQRPLFCPPNMDNGFTQDASSLPYVSYGTRNSFYVNLSDGSSNVDLLNGSLYNLRQRNYGYDYFTTALPTAQDGSPMSVDTSGGNFTISALRLSNALQVFAEKNQVCGPDFLQVCRARYGKAPSSGVAQRPILLGSADFPMYTSGVEQTSGSSQQNTGNPFAGMAARYGRAHAEGSDFVCEAEVDEPSYLMVMCSLVPEANYATGIAHDMRLFTREGSIVDLPVSQLELSGMEPIYDEEVGPYVSPNVGIFGYQPRYMWHKAGAQNEVHGLFRQGASLEAFIPQRAFLLPVAIGNNFLQVAQTDLDNVTAVSGSISQYGVMIDSSIELYASEPLNEGQLPSLVDPAAEHGHSVYVKRGGISVND